MNDIIWTYLENLLKQIILFFELIRMGLDLTQLLSGYNFAIKAAEKFKMVLKIFVFLGDSNPTNSALRVIALSTRPHHPQSFCFVKFTHYLEENMTNKYSN